MDIYQLISENHGQCVHIWDDNSLVRKLSACLFDTFLTLTKEVISALNRTSTSMTSMAEAIT